MGRLVPYKGYQHLIEAMVHLDDDYVLLIGGDGPLRAELLAQTEKLGLQERVKFLGFISDKLKPAYFAACDVFCLSSTIKTEAYAIVLVEAMSLSRPVVATKIPESGVSWVNEDGVSGINVPVEDAPAWRGLSIRSVLTLSFGRPIARVLVVASMMSLLKMR